jgi:hypothetical protein
MRQQVRPISRRGAVEMKDFFMSIYEELRAATRARMIRDKKFEVAANMFPERLRRAPSNTGFR